MDNKDREILRGENGGIEERGEVEERVRERR